MTYSSQPFMGVGPSVLYAIGDGPALALTVHKGEHAGLAGAFGMAEVGYHPHDQTVSIRGGGELYVLNVGLQGTVFGRLGATATAGFSAGAVAWLPVDEHMAMLFVGGDFPVVNKLQYPPRLVTRLSFFFELL